MAHLESLVVLDPSTRSRAALVFGFERAGYSVYATAEGTDALAMAQTRVPQLLVASAQKHDDEGPTAFEVIGRLREEEATRELPIVVLGERGAREEALRAGADEFVSRPAFIRDVVTLSRLAVAVRQDGDATGVSGVLEDYGLFFLTRALAVAGRSGVIDLDRGRRSGELHLSKGEVVFARVGRMVGVPAFQQLLLWHEATMSLRFESPAGERKINVPIDELLATGARFGREFEKLAARIGGTSAVFRQTPTRAASARSQIPTEVLGLIKLYDGKRPLVDIVEDSPFKPFDTVKITHRLIELNAIARVDTSAVDSPLTAQLAVRDWLLGSTSDEPRSTVTDAGRRAAEAYAEEEARRAAVRRPADDLFDEGERPLDAGGATAVNRAGSSSLQETRRGKKKHKQQPQPQRPLPTAPAAPPTAKTPAPPPPAVAAPPAAAPATPTATPAPTASAPAPAEKAPVPAATAAAKTPAASPPTPTAKTPAATAAAPAPTAAKPAAPAHAAATLPGKGKAAAGKPSPASKDPVFNDVEEDFFARESDLAKVSPVESFDDLDGGDPKKKPAPKRRWFLFGARDPSQSDSKKR